MKDLTQYYVEIATRRAKEDLASLQDLLKQTPECEEFLLLLLTVPHKTITAAFGASWREIAPWKRVRPRLEKNHTYDRFDIFTSPDSDDALSDFICFIRYFIGHEMLDDGCATVYTDPAYGLPVFCNNHPKGISINTGVLDNYAGFTRACEVLRQHPRPQTDHAFDVQRRALAVELGMLIEDTAPTPDAASPSEPTAA